ncbi:MAG: CFI-box-CTERM domain-containing protein [Lachnospiraceae bacterium]|nr:CFI-box-CTERM domain-containing protein [Lachnospiraceae bacterium]
MKCQVCGAESGKYPLCRECNKKKETGEIIKCPKCQKWHYTNMPCAEEKAIVGEKEKFLYELRPYLVTATEMKYLNAIKGVLPENCLIQAQANLASFIVRTDGARFQNELYRNVDFLITDLLYKPLLVIEINDQTHFTEERRERDKKVSNICEEAGIPIIKLWTFYGVNQEYIKKRITETLASPVNRVHHFIKEKEKKAPEEIIKAEMPNPSSLTDATQSREKRGCYIATCIYGSYDCPQVWTLRRFRDDKLAKRRIGRIFIKIYYAVSPALVKQFGDKELFQVFWKKCLDGLVLRLQEKGIKDTPYIDLEYMFSVNEKI